MVDSILLEIDDFVKFFFGLSAKVVEKQNFDRVKQIILRQLAYQHDQTLIDQSADYLNAALEVQCLVLSRQKFAEKFLAELKFLCEDRYDIYLGVKALQGEDYSSTTLLEITGHTLKSLECRWGAAIPDDLRHFSPQMVLHYADSLQ